VVEKFPVGFRPFGDDSTAKMTDHALLQRYVRENSQPAFATLVARHVDLVWSAARRQLRSPHLAEEISQSVFLELARQAATLSPTQPLAPWLYVVTRRHVIDHLRRESRRIVRETTAADIADMKTPPASWPNVEADVDEAMAALNDTDRAAILLRYFQNLSLREVGTTLGISDDTAQKRVTRALDRLRTLLTRRGLATTSAALATDLSAQAVQTAPTALAASIASLAGFSGAVIAPTALATAQKLALTAAQKSILAAAALAFAAGVFETWKASDQRHRLATLQTENDQTQSRLRALFQERESARQRTQSLQQQLAAAQTQAAQTVTDAGLAAEIRARLARVKQLRQHFVDHPEFATPEMTFLDDETWLEVSASFPQESPRLTEAMLAIRQHAKGRFAEKLQAALRRYVEAHDGALPGRVTDLAPLFETAVDPALLSRYEMLHTGRATDVQRQALSAMNGSWTSRTSGIPPDQESAAVIVEKDASLLAGEERLRLGPDSFVIVSDPSEFEFLETNGAREKAVTSYLKDHDGHPPTDPAELVPYYPLTIAAQRRLLEKIAELKRHEAPSPFPDLKP